VCDHSFGTCVRKTASIGYCLWTSVEKKSVFCDYSGEET
jgi:hypothetical protein